MGKIVKKDGKVWLEEIQGTNHKKYILIGNCEEEKPIEKEKPIEEEKPIAKPKKNKKSEDD